MNSHTFRMVSAILEAQNKSEDSDTRVKCDGLDLQVVLQFWVAKMRRKLGTWGVLSQTDEMFWSNGPSDGEGPSGRFDNFGAYFSDSALGLVHQKLDDIPQN